MAHLSYRFASMNAGKSTQLLQVGHNYEERGMTVEVFTSALDNRSGLGFVGSRLGIKRAARTFDRETVFGMNLLGRPGCVLVDEAQFLATAQVEQLHQYAHQANVPVIAFGLRTDFRGKPFEGSSALLALADELSEICGVCECGRKATMNIRIEADGSRVRDGSQIEIGGESRYRSVCGGCFYL
jgi:thymidine kinase